MTILIRYFQERLIKCTSCFQVTQSFAYHPTTERKIYKTCANISRFTILSPRDWLVYKTMRSLNTNFNYLALTARKLNIKDKTVRAIACNLSKKGLKVSYSPNTVKIDNQIITEIQYLILQTVNSDRCLFDACYIAKVSRELNINKYTVMYHLEVLKQRGFDILNTEERVKNLEKYILQQMQCTTKPRAEFVKHIANKLELKKRIIQDIVKRIEDKGLTLPRLQVGGFLVQPADLFTLVSKSKQRSFCPQALVPVCPTVLSPLAKMFSAAFSSRHNSAPQIHL